MAELTWAYKYDAKQAGKYLLFTATQIKDRYFGVSSTRNKLWKFISQCYLGVFVTHYDHTAYADTS